MAYVLGFFTADGNMIKNKRGGCYIEFTGCDLEILEKIKTVLKVGNKITGRKRSSNSKICYRIQICSGAMFSDLLKLGMIPNKSLTIKFPDISTKYLRDFVRGYFDGDGCVYLRKNWAKDRGKLRWVFQTRFTSGSEQFLRELKLILKTKKICKGGCLYNKKSGYELVFSHHDGLELFRFMYDNVPVEMYLERKYETFQKAFKTLNLGP